MGLRVHVSLRSGAALPRAVDLCPFHMWELDKGFKTECDILFPSSFVASFFSCTHSILLQQSNLKCYFTHNTHLWECVHSENPLFINASSQTSPLTTSVLSPHRSEVKARQDVKPDFRHPPFTDYRQPPVDYRHPPVSDYRQPPTLDYRHPPGLLDFRQHPAAAQFPLGIPPDFRHQVPLDQEPTAA